MNVVIRRDIFNFAPFLTTELRMMLLREELFGPATVTGDASWRSGRVAHVTGLLETDMVAKAILTVVPSVSDELGFVHPRASRGTWTCEVQLSSYGDGDYFKAHTDNGTPDVTDRWLSWVHYLDAVPGLHLWTGGELVIHDQFWNGRAFNDHTIVVTPFDGETVFFPASAMHEVRPVVAPPGWINRRFSVNGWVRNNISRSG